MTDAEEHLANLMSTFKTACKRYGISFDRGPWEVIAYADRLEEEIEKMREERRGFILENGKMHESWQEADREKLLDNFAFQGAMTRVLNASQTRLITGIMEALKAADDYHEDDSGRAMETILRRVLDREGYEHCIRCQLELASKEKEGLCDECHRRMFGSATSGPDL
jgi:hypothetical protein